MNKHNETNAGFSWRTVDRAKKHGNWLRDLVIALAIALAVSILGMIGDAYAQGKSIQISGNNRTVMVTVPIGKSEDVRTDTSFVDVVVGDPERADSGRSEIHQRGGTESAGADHQHARSFLFRLSGAADLVQHNVAGVAFEFGGVEHSLLYRVRGLPRMRRLSRTKHS